MVMQNIKVSDKLIACYISGVKEKPVLVFVHGAGSTHEVWQAQQQHFEDKAKVIIPDLPGHGNSSGNGYDSIDKYADLIINLIKDLNIDEFVLIGHSMGGAVAQNIALRYPEFLSSLVLIATGARLRVAPQVFKAIESDYKQYIALASSFSMAGSTNKQIRSVFENILTHSSPQSAYSDFLACDKFDIMDKINTIKTKTLIIVGDNDMMTPVKYAMYLNQKINGSELKIIKDAGHMVMMEKPQEVNIAIERFVSFIL